MKLILVFVLIYQSLFAQLAYAANKGKELEYSPEITAEYSAEFFNDMKTVGEFMKFMAMHVPEQEMKNLEGQYQKMGINKDTAIPVVRFEKNKIFFDKNNFTDFIEIKDSKTIIINGYVFKQNKKPYDVNVQEIYKTLSGKKSASLFIEEAHALGGLGIALLAIGGGALIGSFLGPSLFGTTAGEGALGGGVIGGIGALLLGGNLFGRREQLHCHNGGYYHRGPGMGVPGRPIPGQMINQAYGAPMPACLDRNRVHASLNGWGTPPRIPGVPGTPVGTRPVGM